MDAHNLLHATPDACRGVKHASLFLVALSLSLFPFLPPLPSLSLFIAKTLTLKREIHPLENLLVLRNQSFPPFSASVNNIPILSLSLPFSLLPWKIAARREKIKNTHFSLSLVSLYREIINGTTDETTIEDIT